MGSNAIIIDNVVTGVLGEDVHLQCFYSGTQDITDSSWKHLDVRKLRAKMVAGFKSGKPFTRKDSFSTPASQTNLTVKVNLNSLELEGEYSCVFSSNEDEILDTLSLKILGMYMCTKLCVK